MQLPWPLIHLTLTAYSLGSWPTAHYHLLTKVHADLFSQLLYVAGSISCAFPQKYTQQCMGYDPPLSYSLFSVAASLRISFILIYNLLPTYSILTTFSNQSSRS